MTIPRDLFKDLHHLLVLDLSSNRILHVSINILSYLQQQNCNPLKM